MPPPSPTPANHPDGCVFGFNAAIDRRSIEALVNAVGVARGWGFDTVTIAFSSIGGDVEHAFYALNVLMGLPVKIVMHNVGTVASCAAIVFMAGDERRAVPGASFFFHPAVPGLSGDRLTAKVMRNRASAAQLIDARTAKALAVRTGQEEEVVKKWIANEQTIGADQAQSLGIVKFVTPLTLGPKVFFEQLLVIETR